MRQAAAASVSSAASERPEVLAETSGASLQNGGFYKASRGRSIDESLFKVFVCADRERATRCFAIVRNSHDFIVSMRPNLFASRDRVSLSSMTATEGSAREESLYHDHVG
jgi:hypothetical protein